MTDAILIPDMPFADYLARPAYGSSDLLAFRAGPPALVKWRRENHTDTDATRIGTAAHCMILEPDAAASRFYFKAPDEAFRSKEDRARRDEMLAAGTIIMSHAEMLNVRAVVAAFRDKKAAAASLAGAIHREASLFWTCEHSRLPCRARPDWFDADAIYDLKVSVDATKSLDSLRYKAHANGWFHQLAQGRAGLRARGYGIKVGRLVVIAPTEPQGIRTWLLEVSENDLDVVELENENLRAAMLPHHLHNDWPGSPETWQWCPLPTIWAGPMTDDADDEAEPVEEDSDV